MPSCPCSPTCITEPIALLAMPPASDSLIIAFFLLLISSFSFSTSRSFLFSSSTCFIRSSLRAIFVSVVPHVYLPRCGPSAPDLLISLLHFFTSSPLHSFTSSLLHLFILFTTSLLHLFILFTTSLLHLFISASLGLPHLPGAIPELCRALGNDPDIVIEFRCVVTVSTPAVWLARENIKRLTPRPCITVEYSHRVVYIEERSGEPRPSPQGSMDDLVSQSYIYQTPLVHDSPVTRTQSSIENLVPETIVFSFDC